MLTQALTPALDPRAKAKAQAKVQDDLQASIFQLQLWKIVLFKNLPRVDQKLPRVEML